MLCEVCGQKITGKARKVAIEGADLIVCQNCAKFGDSFKISSTHVQKVKTSRIIGPPKIRGIQKTKNKPSRRNDFYSDSYELAEDYMEKIRKAREEKGLSHEELAGRINERVSIIKKIETGKMAPSQILARKLEKELQINIYAPLDSKGSATSSKESLKGLTLGDIINIKKKK
ncbi:MAG: multiprotein bridging factor aMBF1 [Candidatus Jordarchaeum sp.]|uniref:multiprotein bridging factor aMBF1 n=1 Tax=Candidatus Jordarchaeum sp. TaxID=2823881 RepID=UPI00404A412B